MFNPFLVIGGNISLDLDMFIVNGYVEILFSWISWFFL